MLYSEEPSSFEISILRMPHAIGKWWLAYKYLELRKDVFIEGKQWELSQHGHLEFEQYDGGLKPHYVIAHKGNRVLAGVRLLRCNEEDRSGVVPVSYMIRDAYLGRIDLPASIWNVGQPPTDSHTWELTRFVSSARNAKVSSAVLLAANEYMKRQGGEDVLFLCHPALLRVAKKHGYDSTPMGPVVENKSGAFLAARSKLI